MEDTAKLMNSMPGATVKIPTTKYLLLRDFMASSPLTYRHYIYCKMCKQYIMCLPDDSSTTCKCGAKLKTSAGNYFVYIYLERQLVQILETHWDKIVAYNNNIQSDGSDGFLLS